MSDNYSSTTNLCRSWPILVTEKALKDVVESIHLQVILELVIRHSNGRGEILSGSDKSKSMNRFYESKNSFVKASSCKSFLSPEKGWSEWKLIMKVNDHSECVREAGNLFNAQSH